LVQPLLSFSLFSPFSLVFSSSFLSLFFLPLFLSLFSPTFSPCVFFFDFSPFLLFLFPNRYFQGTSTSATSDIEKSPLMESKDADGDEVAAVHDDETEGTAYNYSFFHLSFALVWQERRGETEGYKRGLNRVFVCAFHARGIARVFFIRSCGTARITFCAYASLRTSVKFVPENSHIKKRAFDLQVFYSVPKPHKQTNKQTKLLEGKPAIIWLGCVLLDDEGKSVVRKEYKKQKQEKS
jgi:hypothetical protein